MSFVIEPVVQGAFVRRILAYWGTCTFVAAILLVVIHKFVWPEQDASEHFVGVLSTHWPFVLTSGALLPLVVWDAIRFSNRVVGPIFRVRQVLRRHADGESIRPLQFRKEDFCQELADQINVLLNRLEAAEGKAATVERASKRSDHVVVLDQPASCDPAGQLAGGKL